MNIIARLEYELENATRWHLIFLFLTTNDVISIIGLSVLFNSQDAFIIGINWRLQTNSISKVLCDGLRAEIPSTTPTHTFRDISRYFVLLFFLSFFPVHNLDWLLTNNRDAFLATTLEQRASRREFDQGRHYTHTHTHIYIYIYVCVCVCIYSPFELSSRVRPLYLYWRVRAPASTGVLDTTLNPLVVRLLSWNFREYTVSLHYHYSHSGEVVLGWVQSMGRKEM